MTDDRAEQAFRDAFAQRADRLVTGPLPAVRRRRRLPAVLATVAAVLVLVAGTAIAASIGHDDPPDRTATGPVGGLPAAPDGWRWATWRGVGVQVPERWVVGREPGGDWCAGEDSVDGASYVSQNQDTHGVTLAIGCDESDPAPPAAFGPAPIRLMVPHLTFAEPGDLVDGTSTYEGWTATARTVASVQLRLYTDTGTAELVDRVLGSVRTFTTDDHGCDVTSPVQATEFVRPADAFDVSTVEAVDSVSICQYDRGADPTVVALSGSRRIVGPEADALLAGIQSAAPGGGPDRPRNCVDDMFGDSALVVRMHHDGITDDLYVYYAWCLGNGYDDGTTRRELTADNCAPLFGGTVVAWMYSSFLDRRCGRR